jgi:signal transduction histidine kinase
VHLVGSKLAPLPYNDNSLIAGFLAPDTPFGQPVIFDVQLEGAGGSWLSTGPLGVASFNHLKEGSYRLRVRPRLGIQIGQEATLAFTIRPPWFRSTLAYCIYLLGGIGIVTGGSVFWMHMARREKVRLEKVVAERTAALRASEENYRRLTEELEQRVKQRTAALELSNRELESFSYSVSHDLRAPLRGIDGWSLALLEDYGATLDETARGYLARVRAESQRLGKLIDDLLNLSRTARAELHPILVDLSDMVAGIARRVAETRPETKVEFKHSTGLRAYGDPVLLEVALHNLIDNAWKFSSKKPHPIVEFGSMDTPRGPAYFVRDNGAGFDMRHADKLFGVFQRMHGQEEFPGTGVGLANVQRIIRRHEGVIWADSKLGEGTTFLFTLGRQKPTSTKPAAEQA